MDIENAFFQDLESFKEDFQKTFGNVLKFCLEFICYLSSFYYL